MLHFARRSLLVQLLSVYLVFVIIVLIGGVVVNAVVEQQLSTDVQASDEALAQEIALETSLQLQSAENSLVKLGNLVQASTPAAMAKTFQAFQAARSDVEQVYWIDTVGALRVSCSLHECKVNSGSAFPPPEFSPPTVVQRARAPTTTSPVFEVGIAEETTVNAGVIVAYPVRTRGHLVGIVAASLKLTELSIPPGEGRRRTTAPGPATPDQHHR